MRSKRSSVFTGSDNSNQESRVKISDVQGNILKGFNKPNVRLIFLKFAHDEESTIGLLGRIAARLPSTETLMQASTELTKNRINDPGYQPQQTWLHVSLSKSGIRKLHLPFPPSRGVYEGAGLNTKIVNPDLFPIDAVNPEYEIDQYDPFYSEMKNQADILGDLGESAPETWDEPFTFRKDANGNDISTEVDALFIVASDQEDDLGYYTSQWIEEATHQGVTCVGMEIGKALENEQGKQVEHFGFRDGVSQPLIRGLHNKLEEEKIKRFGDDFINENRKINPDLFYPEDFVLVDLTGKLSWANNGSFLVYRKLEQNVPAFWNFLAEQCKIQNKERPGKMHKITPEEYAARLVGRWKSGAPLAKFPIYDPVAPNFSDDNDFLFRQKREAAVTKEDEDDPEGEKTPIFAHIRLANPRDDARVGARQEAKLDHDENNQHRIIRRGIPYGVSWAKDQRAEAKRGLLFICYQRDIEKQFCFIQSHMYYTNNYRPTGPHAHLLNPLNTDGYSKLGIEHFVTTKGGCYFFSPSISALKDLRPYSIKRNDQ